MADSATPQALAGPEFSFKERVGLVFIVEVAFLSVLATSGVLLYYLYSYVAAIRDPTRVKPSTHIHHYFVSLMVADLIQALGSVLNIRWIVTAAVEPGPLCTTQGALKQAGDVGVAMSTLAIAIHTARVLIFKIHLPSFVPKIAILFIWCFVGLMLGLGFGMHNAKDIVFYGNTGYWCWITEEYPTQRITLEYLWLWIAAIVNIVCYVAIFFEIKGYLQFKGNAQGGPTLSFASSNAPRNSRTSSIARQMLFYPLIYLVCIVPMTASRFVNFAGGKVPLGATIFSSLLFSGSGLLNFLLFRYTRPSLLPARYNGMGFHTQSQPPVEVSVKLEAFKVTSAPGTPREYPDPEYSYGHETPDRSSERSFRSTSRARPTSKRQTADSTVPLV